MAKSKQSTQKSKVTFGSRKKGKHAKRKGPKESHQKRYRAQG